VRADESGGECTGLELGVKAWRLAVVLSQSSSGMGAGKSGCLFVSAGCKVDVARPTYPFVWQIPTELNCSAVCTYWLCCFWEYDDCIEAKYE
jgi:hypothetical protein